MVRSMPYNSFMTSCKWLALLLVVLCCGCVSGARVYQAPEVPTQNLLNSIPDELRYKPKNLAPGENGWFHIAKGFAETPRIEQSWISLFDASGANPGLLKDIARRDALESAFAKFDPYLDATAKCLEIERPGSFITSPLDNPVEVLKGLRVQLSVLLQRAAFRLATGDGERAASDYETCIKLLNQLSASGAPLDYVVIAVS